MATDAEHSGWWPEEEPDDLAAPIETEPFDGVVQSGQKLGRNPARLALGMAVLAAERLRLAGPGDNKTLATGVGLMQQGAAEARVLARRFMRRPLRLADQASDWAS